MKWWDSPDIQMSICKCGMPIHRYKTGRWEGDPSLNYDHVFDRTYEHDAAPVLKEADK